MEIGGLADANPRPGFPVGTVLRRVVGAVHVDIAVSWAKGVDGTAGFGGSDVESLGKSAVVESKWVELCVETSDVR